MNRVVPPASGQALTVEQALQMAIERHNAGDLAQAKKIYDQILQAEPNNSVALHLLGVVAHQVGEHEVASNLISKAVKIDPKYVEAFSNLGLVLERLGRTDEAVASYRKALAINPDHADALGNLGNALTAEGELEEALESYEKAIAIAPGFAEAHCNAGNVLRDLGRPEEAMARYDEALSIEPDFAGAHFGRGNAHSDLGQAKEALASFERALEIDPRYREAHNNYQYVIAQAVKQEIYDICHEDIDHISVSDRLADEGKAVDALSVNLLFCPFVHPVSPPLGISILKSYLEKNGFPDAKCIDLNLQWHDSIAEDETTPYVELGKALREGKKLFKDPDGGFYDVGKYRDASSALVNALSATHYDTQFALCRDETKDDILSFLLPRALEGDPDVVGFSILFYEQMLCSLALAKAIKQQRPETIIVFGGAGLFSSGRFAINSPYVDFVVWDVGEAPMQMLLTSIKKGELSETIPGVEFKRNGASQKNEPVVSNLNHAAYADFSDLDLTAYYTGGVVVPLLTSKGCFWRKCTFCQEALVNLYVEAQISRVVDEIEFHYKNGIQHFQFIDEMIPSDRLRALSEEIIQRGLEVYFYANLRPTADFDQITLDLMFKAGFRYVIWGVESGNRRVLKMVKKGTSVKSIRNTLEYSRKAGIRNHVFMFCGFPSETPDELHETMEFFYENRENIHQFHTGPYVLCEDTPIFLEPEKFDIGIKTVGDNPPTYFAIHKEGTSGLKADEYAAYYQNTFMDKFSLAPGFGDLRDHALLIYSKMALEEHQKIRGDIPAPVQPRHLL